MRGTFKCRHLTNDLMKKGETLANILTNIYNINTIGAGSMHKSLATRPLQGYINNNVNVKLFENYHI